VNKVELVAGNKNNGVEYKILETVKKVIVLKGLVAGGSV